MVGASTITQKGQIVIPVAMRKALGLRASSRVLMHVEDNKIVLRRAMTLDEACGFITIDKGIVSREEEKEAVRKAVAEKYKKENMA